MERLTISRRKEIEELQFGLQIPGELQLFQFPDDLDTRFLRAGPLMLISAEKSDPCHLLGIAQ